MGGARKAWPLARIAAMVVAVVGVGAQAASGAAVQRGQPGWFPMSQVYSDDDTTVSVNAGNGRLYVEARDVKPTAGDDQLAMTRYYNGVDGGPLSFNNR